MAGPLDGFRIIDLTTMISGPFATMTLADQGADVIKVETPGTGDLLRYAGPARGGISALFLTSNRNKRSVALDLKSDGGKRALTRLIEGADVLVQNFRPGALTRVGFDEPAVRRIRPDIVYASISGYGETGPYSHQRVYDPVIQAVSGLMSVQGGNSGPQFVSTVVPDKNASLTMAQAITAALLHRERTGEGQHVKLAMLDALVAWLWPDGMMNHTYIGDGVSAPMDLSAAYSEPMPTRDGVMVAAVISDAEWRGFCHAAERPDLLESEQYATLADRTANFADLMDLIRGITTGGTTAEWLERLDAHDVPCAPINSLTDVLTDPQIVTNGMVVERLHPTSGAFRDAEPAVSYSGTPSEVRCLAPQLGEHTEEVLREAGFNDADIRQLLADGAGA